MSLTVVDAGITKLLNSYLNKVQPATNNLTLRLFVNNVTPDDTFVAGGLTEAAGGGYAAKVLAAGSWTISTVANIVQAAYALQSFIFSGALTTNTTIYGYYITDGDGTLICAERASGTFVPAANGDYYDVTPIIQGSKGTPA